MQSRVSLVLAATAVIFAIVMLLMQNSQRHQMEFMLEERAAETSRVLTRVLEVRGSPQRLHADDYSRWDEFVRFVRTRDAHWGESALTSGIQTFGLDAVWVLDDRFHVLYTSIPGGDARLRPIPALPGVLATALRANPVRHFYAVTPCGPLEVWTSSIVPTADLARVTRPVGYYVIGRLWTPARIAELGSIAGGTVRIVPVSAAADGASSWAETGRIEVRKPLEGAAGRPVATLLFTTSAPVAHQVNAALRTSAVLALLGTILGLVLVWWALARWVGRPLRAITYAMQRGDVSSLADVAAQDDDLGEVARLVQEFFAQHERLVEARKAAEAAALAKSHFLASISHELRTPMHGILSFARFGMRDAATAPREDLRADFRQVNECGESLLSLLNSLLDLSRLEAGRMPFTFAETPLDEVAIMAIDEFRPFCDERQVALTSEIEPRLPCVLADRMRLLQVVRNMISNAGKFTPAGGSIVVRALACGASQRIEIEDTGIGIPAGEEELIFREFTQSSQSGSRSGGTGLGLAICREIVEAHDGRIWAENREGGGARVTFEIPVAGPQAARVPGAGDAPADPGTNAGAAVAHPADRWKKAA